MAGWKVIINSKNIKSGDVLKVRAQYVEDDETVSYSYSNSVKNSSDEIDAFISEAKASKIEADAHKAALTTLCNSIDTKFNT